MRKVKSKSSKTSSNKTSSKKSKKNKKKISILPPPSLFNKADYTKDDVIEKKLVFKKTYIQDRGDHDKKYFVFTEPGKRKEVRIHAHTKLIEAGPRFKGNGTFIIGYDNVGTAFYIIKDNDVWFKFMNCMILHERNGELFRNCSESFTGERLSIKEQAKRLHHIYNLRNKSYQFP